MARSTMATLIARLRRELDGDTTLTDDQLQELLDANSGRVTVCLETVSPFYTTHLSGLPNWESSPVLFADKDTIVSTNDYTLDELRGIVTMDAEDSRELYLAGAVYDLHGAASQGWTRIGERYALEYDFEDIEGSYKRSQQIKHCEQQAARHAALAWQSPGTLNEYP